MTREEARKPTAHERKNVLARTPRHAKGHELAWLANIDGEWHVEWHGVAVAREANGASAGAFPTLGRVSVAALSSLIRAGDDFPVQAHDRGRMYSIDLVALLEAHDRGEQAAEPAPVGVKPGSVALRQIFE